MKNTHETVQKIIRATKLNFESHSQLLPTFFVGNDTTIKIVGAAFENPSEKDAAANAVKTIAETIGASFVIFSAETWILDGPTASEEYQSGKFRSIKEHPKAKEKIIFTIEDSDGTQVGMADISKNRKMGPVKWLEKSEAEGRFTNLLKKTSH